MQRIGDYNLIEEIGAGGMGQVYLAENVHHKKRYALKVLPAALAQDPGFRQRFLAEARVMSELDHPSIVRVHHMGEDQGTYFLVMDYVAGPAGKPQSLLDVLKAASSGRIEPERLAPWARQIAEGLAHAHGQGVVHRDIKPANVLLDHRNRVRITDFGLAKAAGSEFLRSLMHEQKPEQETLSDMPTAGPEVTPSPTAQCTLSDQPTWKAGGQGRPGQTSTGSLLGTYDYMSPEQRGELPNVELGPASDVYSFGVMVYQLLTGRRPTGRKGAADIVPGLSNAWDRVIDRCIEYQPQDRYRDGTELLEAIKTALLVGGTTSRRTWFLLSTVLLLGCIVVGAYWVWRNGPAGLVPDDRQPSQVVTVGGQQTEAQDPRPQGPEESQTVEAREQKESPGQSQRQSKGPGPKAQRPRGKAKGHDNKKPKGRDQTANIEAVTPAVRRDLVVIVNCEDTMLLDQAQNLFRTELNARGLSIEYVGDSQKASVTEIRAKHAGLLAQSACPFILTKVQAVDQYDEVFGKKLALSTVTVSIDLFEAGSREPKKNATQQEPRSSLSMAKARKDALDLALPKAMKEILHELE